MTTTSRPPGFSARSAANSASASSPSSSLTKTRSAWKTRVAGWILSLALRGLTHLDEACEFARRGEGLLGAALLDGAGDAARLLFLAEETEDADEIADLGAIDDIGRADTPARRHAHVERTVALEGEAAIGLVDLHGGDADIEHDAIKPAFRARNRSRRTATEWRWRRAACRRIDQRLAGGNRIGVAIERDHLGIRGQGSRAV